MIKSHLPLSPLLRSTLNYVPVKKLILRLNCFLISTNIGATIGSERAFSVSTAKARVMFSANSSLKSPLGVTGSTVSNNSTSMAGPRCANGNC